MTIEIIEGDCRNVLPELADKSVNCIVTSPPYFGLRDYGVDGQMGLEPTPDEFVLALVGVLREARRVLRDDGTLWLNLGDSYAGSWGAQGRGGAPSERSTLAGNGHVGGGPKLKSLSRVQIDAHSHKESGTGTIRQSGLKPKDLIGIPWAVAFALRADGWYLRQDIIWHKPNPMPESVTDRCTKAHEYIFLLSKSPTYYFDNEAMQEPATGRPPGNKKPTKGGREYAEADGEHHRTAANLHEIGARETRNRRSVWTVTTKPFKEAHFATFPPDLIEPCILAGCPAGGTVLDPFFGAGTTGLVCQKHDRNCIGIELSPVYFDIAVKRLGLDQPEMQAAE
jgi:DNA modification methylase